MADDDRLREKFSSLSEASGELSFEVTSSSEISVLFEKQVGKSSNPIYRISLHGSKVEDSIVYTLLLNASTRPATRAEAFCRMIATIGDEVFQHNPILMIYDYAGQQFMAVSAAKLLEAFHAEAEKRQLPTSKSAKFALSPNFENQTISMYGLVNSDDIWSCRNIQNLTVQDVFRELSRMNTENRESDSATLVAAIRRRIDDGLQSRPEFHGLERLAQSEVDRTDEDELAEITISPRLWRMIKNCIKSHPAVVLIGPPGTGKTQLLRKAIHEIEQEQEKAIEALWVTPDESWTVGDLIGGDTIVDGRIEFRPGWVLRSIEEGKWLVIDEANRGDMDRVFGGLLTWLSGRSVFVGVESGETNARKIMLDWINGESQKLIVTHSGEELIKYSAGTNWRMLATYNAVDAQRVFRFGQALGRRFARVPVPAASSDDMQRILEQKAKSLGPKIIGIIKGMYEAHLEGEETIVGPASFLSMVQYIENALKGIPDGQREIESKLVPDTEEASEEAIENLDSFTQSILAEAYLVHIGATLANLELDDLQALEDRAKGKGVLNDEEWAWIRAMIPALG